MKIISLNVWGGQVHTSLMAFFEEKKKDIGVFLLQEVFMNATERTLFNDKEHPYLFKEIQDLLSDYAGYFAPAESEEYGLAIFIRKDITMKEVGDIFVHRWKNAMDGTDAKTLGKNLQYCKIKDGSRDLILCNFHGLWNAKDKDDSDDRLKQSEKVLEFIAGGNDPTILAGDFNLSPDTKSLAMLEKGMRNLIKEYGITSTRTSYYEKENKFADYVLVSPEIEVKAFKVLPDEVSDHAALYLEI